MEQSTEEQSESDPMEQSTEEKSESDPTILKILKSNTLCI